MSLNRLHNRSNKDSQEAPLTQLGRRFGLSNELDTGVWCGENGVFVGAVPLLDQAAAELDLTNGSRGQCPISIAISVRATAYPLNSIRKSEASQQPPGR